MESIFIWKGRKTEKVAPLPATTIIRGLTINAFKRSYKLFLKKWRIRKWFGRWLFFVRIIWSSWILGKEKKEGRALISKKISDNQKSNRRRSLFVSRLNLQNRTFSWINMAQLLNHYHSNFYACHCQYLRLHVILQHFMCRRETSLKT